MKLILLPAALCLVVSAPAMADDLEIFLSQLNVQAKSDGSNFAAQLSAQFQVDRARVDVTLRSVPKPADAFMVLQLSQWSHRPPEEVIKVYRVHRRHGWGRMANELGIRPGSQEFHAMKRGDLHFQGHHGHHGEERREERRKGHREDRHEDRRDDRHEDHDHGRGHGHR